MPSRIINIPKWVSRLPLELATKLAELKQESGHFSTCPLQALTFTTWTSGLLIVFFKLKFVSKSEFNEVLAWFQ